MDRSLAGNGYKFLRILEYTFVKGCKHMKKTLAMLLAVLMLLSTTAFATSYDSIANGTVLVELRWYIPCFGDGKFQKVVTF